MASASNIMNPALIADANWNVHDEGAIALRCSGVTKHFGDVQAVAGLDLAVGSGRILALLGPSGCGKTTTLRLIAGFEHPDAGEICIGDRIVSTSSGSLPPEKRRIGIVFQEGALFPHLTVEQNVGYGLKKSPDREARIAEALSLVELSGMRRRMPHELSGGQQQRVALGRALAPRPDILLMDEPFSNLDAKLSEQLRRDVANILRESGVTAIFVTHDQESALLVGDDVALMKEGRLEQTGTPASIFHSPATKYAAEFMGVVDFLPVRIQDGKAVSELGETQIPADTVNVLEQSGVELMVRPDCLECILDGDTVGMGGMIVGREFRGAFYLYRVRLPSGVEVRCLMPHIADFPLGTRVSVRLREGHRARIFVNGQLADQGSHCH